ncbi:hypothetical protein BC351_40190 [Paenibacillus ferrarius]|uniref:Uncharacterized protein n=1 Tax=Paenibacillus ferrarius TaxID=1469647 RepID=A0A1V4H868_9BACL|nr:hypothetical protein [Paenibacillus ferrarius]OPH47377.1 hypothetical protein BC351_40190 [Paenibacillus ferrarius]
MNNKFLLWVKSKESVLQISNITCEIRDSTAEVIEKKSENPCQIVFFDSGKKMGSVCVWKSGFMDIEILDFDTEKKEYYKHSDDIGLNPDFDDILREFLDRMVLQ